MLQYEKCRIIISPIISAYKKINKQKGYLHKGALIKASINIDLQISDTVMYVQVTEALLMIVIFLNDREPTFSGFNK